MDMADLIANARNGSQRAAGRLLSLVEGDRRDEVLAGIGGSQAILDIWITGPPGAGKSPTIPAPVGAYHAPGRRVGVLAVGPSSTFSVGPLLGARSRMTRHLNDPKAMT